MRDVLLTGKVYEAVRGAGRAARTTPSYDAVVLDAPPTGRITRFLNVNAEVAGLAKVGPIRGQADAIMRFLRSPQTAVHLVTLLEEMPVQETADAVAELTAAGLPVGGVVVNAVREPLLKRGRPHRGRQGPARPGAEVAAGLEAAGVDVRAGVVDALLVEVAEHAERVALEKPERRTLKALGRPTYELPLLAEGVDLGGLYGLAERLCAGGARDPGRDDQPRPRPRHGDRAPPATRIVVCCGVRRGRQDDDRGRAGAAGGRAGPRRSSC